MPEALILLALVVAAALWSRWLSARVGWAPAGGLSLLAATPLVPYVPVGFGISLDDAFPVVGIASLLFTVDAGLAVAARDGCSLPAWPSWCSARCSRRC